MRKYLYPILVLCFGAAIAALFFFRKPELIPKLKERHGDLTLGGEWLNTKNAIGGLMAEIRAKPDDNKPKLLLAQAYMQEARVTGDHPYYDMAAMQLLNGILKKEPKNFEALCCKASLCLTQHHFSEGLAVAQQAVEINPHNAFVYGLLCDANVELGRYDEAVKMADKMNQVRPDLRSYSRVSYLREIYGDYPGAIEAMDMAAKAGYPGLEQTGWARTTLGHLYENTGDLIKAENQYRQTLQERPFYAYALAGLGRVEKARQNYPAAIEYFRKARATVKDYAFADELTDLYRLNHEPAKATQMAKEAISMLAEDAKEADENEEMGHYADRELAYAYLKTNELDKALAHAKLEYDRRPDNIDVNETRAWVHYKRGEYKDAQTYMAKARRTRSQNPTLLCRAGLIATKNGNAAEGQALIRKALSTNPYLSMDLADEGKKLLAAN
ncbi:Tetratricopeptide repeat-containing protein [Hymenobacter daecheongensis DSM 21074]|uniref:Tetratricopeptide repeat-containing protein n=1 Tax=Hymenobacter daecheongensis DSM 21074 TaxID=1121955 RepID=A0A1M6D755_9BACT|nr:tetratricopeptide repeat protein [Hymenobacter daecheongensis]SHI69052.1 Tetratricopeptide repeat-containing protein [Hymenobacter daecheongensis DSM 21074]